MTDDRPRPLTARRRCAYCGCAITRLATTCNRCRRLAALDDVSAEARRLEAAELETYARQERC